MDNRTPIHQLRSFLLIAFGITWIFWGIPAILQLPLDTMPAPILMAVGGSGPAVAALVLLYRYEDDASIKDYWSRLLDPRRLGVKWAAVSLMLPPALLLAAGLADGVSGGTGVILSPLYSSRPFSLVSLIAFTLFFGPIPEEMGWRGYALDRLQSQLKPASAATLLGFIWLFWHLPLFFFPGTYQSGLGFSSPGFWLFVVGIVPQSILMAWIYNASNRSTLSAVLYHFAINYFGTTLVISSNATILLAGLWVLAAIAAMLLLKPFRH